MLLHRLPVKILHTYGLYSRNLFMSAIDQEAGKYREIQHMDRSIVDRLTQ